MKSWVESLAQYHKPEVTKMFEKYKVLSHREIESRIEIYLEQYAKHINIEARTAVHMAKRLYIPSIIAYTRELAETVNQIKQAGGTADVQSQLLGDITALLKTAQQKTATLEKAANAALDTSDAKKRAEMFRDDVFSAQTALRADIDALEAMIPSDGWPVPSYADMLFDF